MYLNTENEKFTFKQNLVENEMDGLIISLQYSSEKFEEDMNKDKFNIEEDR